jgi:DNA-binding transcriptional regulator YdaS (Cro superfamily)
VEKGLVGIALAGGERDAGVTVNEFETLLMRHDLREVLEDPLRFLARQGRRLFAEPHAIAAKSWGYAKYDVVHLLNELIDALGLSESAVERLIARLMAVPAARALRLKRAVRLLVAGAEPAVVRGTYQSPILIQWQPTARRARTLEITLTRFR